MKSDQADNAHWRIDARGVNYVAHVSRSRDTQPPTRTLYSAFARVKPKTDPDTLVNTCTLCTTVYTFASWKNLTSLGKKLDFGCYLEHRQCPAATVLLSCSTPTGTTCRSTR